MFIWTERVNKGWKIFDSAFSTVEVGSDRFLVIYTPCLVFQVAERVADERGEKQLEQSSVGYSIRLEKY